MTIANVAGFVSANTYYESAAADLFARPQLGDFSLFSAEFQMSSGKAIGLETFGPAGEMAELVGSRRFGGLREYLKTLVVKTYSSDPSLELDSKDARGDISGALRARIDDFLNTGLWAWEKFALEVITGNATGIDGVALLHDSHPYAFGGGTWDNLTTDALSFSSFNAGYAAMTGLLSESGAPLGLTPTHLMVGPALARTALEIVGGDRPVAMSSSGALDATSSVVAAAVIENTWRGRVKVIVNPRITSATAWYLMDLSKSAKPVAFAVLDPVTGYAAIDGTDPGRISRSVNQYYLEGKAAFGGWFPQMIYGNAG